MTWGIFWCLGRAGRGSIPENLLATRRKEELLKSCSSCRLKIRCRFRNAHTYYACGTHVAGSVLDQYGTCSDTPSSFPPNIKAPIFSIVAYCNVLGIFNFSGGGEGFNFRGKGMNPR